MERDELKNVIEEYYYNTRNVTFKEISKVVETYKTGSISIEGMRDKLNNESNIKNTNYSKVMNYYKNMALNLGSETLYTKSLKTTYNTITIPSVTIDLLNVTEAESLDELKEVTENIKNINVNYKDNRFEGKDFREIKKIIIKDYQDSLIPIYSINKISDLFMHILEKILLLGKFNDEEKDYLYNKYNKIIKDAISHKTKNDKLYAKLKEEIHSEEISEKILDYLYELDFLSPPGFKRLKLTDLEKLSEIIENDYNSIFVYDVFDIEKISIGIIKNNKYIHKSSVIDKAIEYTDKHKKKLIGNALISSENYNNKFSLMEHEELLDEVTSYIKFIFSYSGKMPIFSILYNLIYSGENLVPLKNIEVNSTHEQEIIEKLKDIDYPYIDRKDLNLLPEIITGKKTNYDYDDFSKIRKYLNIFDGCFNLNEFRDRLDGFYVKEKSWYDKLSLEEIVAIFSTLKPLINDSKLIYSECNFEDKEKRKKIIKKIKEIRKLDKDLIDGIGVGINCNIGCSYKEFMDTFQSIKKEFDLPIYIEAIDVCAQNKYIKLLEDNKISSMEVERLRYLTLKELFNAISDAKKEKIQIENVTVSTLTDFDSLNLSKYNSDLPLNEKISNDHSGFYNEDFSNKYTFELKKDTSKTALHNHTVVFNNRPNTIPIQQFVDEALKLNITTLGFANFIPYPKLDIPNEYMNYDELDEYILKIDELNKKNDEIDLLIGFECDYNPDLEGYLCELRSKSDYLILGRRLSGIMCNFENNPNYPLAYADEVCKAIKTGLYDIIAYPDYFMAYRDTILLNKDKQLFMDNAVKAMEKICRTALEYDVVVEFNYNSIDDLVILDDGNMSYNHPLTWNIIKDFGCRIIYGTGIGEYNKMNLCNYYRTMADYIIDPEELNVIKDDYNPKEYRTANKKIQEALLNTMKKAFCYEAVTAKNLLYLELEQSNNHYKTIVKAIKNLGERYRQNVLIRKEYYKHQIKSLDLSIFDEEEKAKRKDRYLYTIDEIEETYKYQKDFLKSFMAAATLARENGCISKESYIEFIVNSLETKYGFDKEKREEAYKNVLYTKNVSETDNDKDDNSVRGIANAGMLIILVTVLSLVGGYLFFWFIS